MGELCALADAKAAEVADVIGVFRDPSRSFLMPPAGETLEARTVIDISHESLMRVWQRLIKWTDEEARSARTYCRLAETADLHAAGNANLLRDPELQLAIDWRDKNHPNETWASRYHPRFAAAMRFLTESSEAREAERAERERQRQRELEAERDKAEAQARYARLMGWAALVSGALFVVALGGGMWAHEASRTAHEALITAKQRQQEAQEASRIAEAKQKEAQEYSRIAEAKQKEAQQYLREMQITQSRSLVEAAKQNLIAARPDDRPEAGRPGDQSTRILLALEALPDVNQKIDRPVFFAALQSLTDGLNNLRELAVVRGHTDAVNSVAVTPDGSRIVTGSSDKTARVWDAHTGADLPQFKDYTDAIRGVAVTPDGTRIVTSSSDNTARVWDARTGAELQLKGHSDIVKSVAVTPDGTRIITGSSDKTARVWDANSGIELFPLEGHTDVVNSVAVTPDGARIVTASSDNTARVWDAHTRAELLQLKGHTGAVNSVAVTSDGARIVTASSDNTARVWDAKTGAELLQLKGHIDSVNSVAVTSDGAHVVTGSSDNTARVWDAKTGAELLQFKGHTDRVNSVAATPDGARVITGSDDRTMRIWDARTEAELLQLKGHTKAVIGAAVTPDGGRIITGSSDNTARVWDAWTGAELLQLVGHTDAVNGVAVIPDGGRIVTGSSDKTVRLWDARTGAELLQLKADTDEACSKLIAFLFPTRGLNKEREARLAQLLKSLDPVGAVPPVQIARFPQYADKRKQLLDAAIRTNLIAATGPEPQANRASVETYCEPSVNAVAVTPDGARIVSGANDSTARVWDAKTGVELLQLKGHTGAVNSVAVTPDGARIVTGSSDNTARIWDAKTGAALLQLKGHTRPVLRVAVTPDGSRVVTGSLDNTARAWDAGTGAELLQLKGHTSGVRGIAVTPDGSRIVTGSRDKTARVWDAHTGAELLRKGDIDRVNNVAVMADGTHMVTVSLEGGSRLWDLAQLRPPPVQYQFSTPETQQALVDRAKAVVPRCLTIEQRQTFLLGPRPPGWCIETAKYPYDGQHWKAWKAGKIAEAVDPETADSYGNFADAAVRAGDFRIALEAAELGIQFGPEKIWIRGNRAHALMFLDRIPEARDEYLAHRGTQTPNGLWEEAVVKDFQAYREQSRQHELMSEIENIFKPSLPAPTDE